MRAMFVATFGLIMLSSFGVRAAAPTTATAATTSSAPASPTARRANPSDLARHPAVQSAMAELAKEVESALRSGADAPREQSNYFVGQTDIPPAAIVAVLRRPLGGDVRVQSYVKWQLLSALPDPLDEKTAGELLQVYRSAPPPFPRPGSSKQQRDELERMIRGARENEAEALAARFEQMVERVARDNQYLLAYRDQLFAKLPPSYDALAAGFEDAAARVNAGADAAEHVRNVCKALSQWVNAGAASPPPEQLKAMSRAIAQLEKQKGQECYNRLYWNASSERMTFSKSQESLARVSQLEEGRELLDDTIRNPTVPLKMKEQR